MTRIGSRIPSEKISDKLVLFRAWTGTRTHLYKRTYAKRMYHVGRRKFVIWNGMICWLRNAYKGHFVVWQMESLDSVVSS